jgi:hypothetical protein
MTRLRRHPAILPAACAVLTLAVLAPLLAPGYVLAYDMVFTPRQALLPDTLGLGSALPRAVPVDAVVALLTTVLPGQVVQKCALAGAVFGAALGAGRLVPTDRLAVRLVAAAAYAWNAYLAERLFLGHWSLLLAYASLPWVVAAALRLRRGEPGAWAGVVLASLPAVLVPTGGVLAAAAAMVCAGRRRLAGTAAIALALNAPWWLPAALRPGGSGSDPAGAAAFAARSEGPGGPLVSLVGLGGIWNAQVVPGSRAGPLVPAAALVLAAGVGIGLRHLIRAWGGGAAGGLAALAAGGLFVAAAGALPGTSAALGWGVAHLPGAGLLRDGQKWTAWWALLAAVCCALAVEAAARRLPDPGPRAVLLAGALLLPVVLLPDLAWGGWGRLAPVAYPADWSATRDLLARDPRPGDVLVLPLSAFRRFDWNGGRTVLDPAPRFLPRAVVVEDTLPVGAVRVRGEDPRVGRVRDALRTGAPLGRLGIGWVLVERGGPGESPPAVPRGLATVHIGEWLALYRVPGAVLPAPAGAPRPPVLAADAATLILILAAVLRRWLPIGRLSSLTGPAARRLAPGRPRGRPGPAGPGRARRSEASRKGGGSGADPPTGDRFVPGRRRARADGGVRAGVGERAGREGGAADQVPGRAAAQRRRLRRALIRRSAPEHPPGPEHSRGPEHPPGPEHPSGPEHPPGPECG